MNCCPLWPRQKPRGGACEAPLCLYRGKEGAGGRVERPEATLGVRGGGEGVTAFA